MAEHDEFILTIDQGTTGSRALLVDRSGRIAHQAYEEFTQILPQPGWVEHDAEEIWASVQRVVSKVGEGKWKQIRAIGITNQRETSVLWSEKTQRPIHNAIVWQDRRTEERCRELRSEAEWIAEKTGLVIDAYFSATKAEWLLKHSNAKQADLRFGTIDSWLIYKLTGGRVHVTDFTNASRTMLFDIHQRKWDEQLLKLFGVPAGILPKVVSSAEIVGETDPACTGGISIPIAGIAGDQQAALFGQRAWSPGQAKNTYGTGAFLLMNLGKNNVRSRYRLLTTLACDAAGQPVYALEGSVFIAGAAIQWLRDQLQILPSARESEALAASIADNGGVYFVPALVGLGAPHWNSQVRGAIFGLTRGSGRPHLVRAALEAMAYQSAELLEAMRMDSGIPLTELRTDGGASSNNWLMQFQADVLNVPVIRNENVEMTATGAAYLAGIGAGVWTSTELAKLESDSKCFEPRRSEIVARGFAEWKRHLSSLLRG
ncbi:MAG TPA: glycerol kinase GlpK [Tepidisphaeraceae bacterium]|jgi:glycerol kinase